MNKIELPEHDISYSISGQPGRFTIKALQIDGGHYWAVPTLGLVNRRIIVTKFLYAVKAKMVEGFKK